MHFYDAESEHDAESETPYKSYFYQAVRCGDGADTECEGPGAEVGWIFTRSDGTMERLFVRSPDRPFYLEPDQEDGDYVGRLVITFVPSADQDPVDAVE